MPGWRVMFPLTLQSDRPCRAGGGGHNTTGMGLVFMAQAMTVAVDGVFIKSEHKEGVSTNQQSGVVEPYSYDVAHILVDVDVVHARIEDTFRTADLPAAGETFRCDLRISAYRNQGQAELAARLLRRLPLLPAALADAA